MAKQIVLELDEVEANIILAALDRVTDADLVAWYVGGDKKPPRDVGTVASHVVDLLNDALKP